MSSESSRLSAFVSSEALGLLPDLPERGSLVVEDVHRELSATLRDELDAECLHGRQAAVPFPHARGDAPGHAHVRGRELDVVGDEERSGTHDGGSGGGVWPRGSEVRRAPGLGHSLGQAFEARLTNGGKDLAPRVARRACVQVDGQLEAIGDAFGELGGADDALVHGRVAEGHEGHDVDGADARVSPCVLRHVDTLECDLHGRLHGAHHAPGIAGHGVDRATVVGVSRAVEEPRTPVGLDGLGDGIERGLVAAFAEVGHALDEALHGVHGPDASSARDAAPLGFEPFRLGLR